MIKNGNFLQPQTFEACSKSYDVKFSLMYKNNGSSILDFVSRNTESRHAYSMMILTNYR